MIELPLVLLGGLLGSSHCIGMCGGFALMMGVDQPSHARNLLIQLAYSLGRISTYAFLGALAGFVGMKLSAHTWAMHNVPAVLCLFAGVYLIVEGLTASGWTLWRREQKQQSGCLFGSQFASLLRGGRYSNAFAAGILTGFLPCGLVYAFLSLAASTGSIGWGAGVMATFGLGTVPLMVLTGIGASLLSLVHRRRMMQVAAWCVVLTGLLTVARGASYIHLTGGAEAANCPLCIENPAE